MHNIPSVEIYRPIGIITYIAAFVSSTAIMVALSTYLFLIYIAITILILIISLVMKIKKN